MDNENTSAPQSGATTPQVDLSPIEQRLNRITESVAALTKRDQDREVRAASERLKGYEAQIANAIRDAEGAVDAAERAMAQAHEDGDPLSIAKATRRLTDAVAEREAVRLEKREFDRAKAAQQERRTGGSEGARGQRTEPAQGTRDTTNLNDWKSRNSEWYGVDTDMTKAAHEIDKQIRQAGVIPVGSQDYFKAIDRQMAQRYPDRFKSSPNTSGAGGTPAGGQRPSTGRIPRDVLDTWAKMGINVQDDKVLERVVKGREQLVAKGILPQEPAYGRVI